MSANNHCPITKAINQLSKCALAITRARIDFLCGFFSGDEPLRGIVGPSGEYSAKVTPIWASQKACPSLLTHSNYLFPTITEEGEKNRKGDVAQNRPVLPKMSLSICEP